MNIKMWNRIKLTWLKINLDFPTDKKIGEEGVSGCLKFSTV